MRIEGEAKLVRIFIGESDHWGGKPLYQALVQRARDMGLAGATVLRGIEGFGASSVVHTARILRLSEDLPIVVELVDTTDKIEEFLHVTDEMVTEGMVTVLRRGRPTGAAMPLMWAHAEYIKLLRSSVDGQVFDFIPDVAARYWSGDECRPLEIWKPNRQPATVKRGWTLRIQTPQRFDLVWTESEWEESTETPSTSTSLLIYYVDIPIGRAQRAPIRFTFRWEGGRWEGCDYVVDVV